MKKQEKIIDGKFNFKNEKIWYAGYNHASSIKKDYDITVRGIIFKNEKIIYIRLNDFVYIKSNNPLQGRRQEAAFNRNLDGCIAYLKAIYKGYKIYTSLTINKLDYELRRYILST